MGLHPPPPSPIMSLTMVNLLVLLTVPCVMSYSPVDIKLDEKAKQIHRIDSFNILAYVFLVILTVCTIWLFKRTRHRFMHETGLAIIYGLIIGCIMRYAGQDEGSFSHMWVTEANDTNSSDLVNGPPDSIWIPLSIPDKKDSSQKHNSTYVYVFRGQLAHGGRDHDISHKATFDPEIFFNIILPPIIFNAGYSLKKRYFFRNIGAIMTYAFVGTTISCFTVGSILYGFAWMIPGLGFNFNDCLYFGAITSATDPVTILAIFNDLHVDVTLYALVFGESILNDAVAITLAGSIDMFDNLKNSGDQFKAALQALINFMQMFTGSLMLGAMVGCSTALLTKYTRLQDFPLLETCLFVLMSYSTFLMGEVLEFSGIVAVLFCGICQAHYTQANLTDESKQRTKQLFELLNFMAENFIFTYIGVSMFTYPTHKWKVSFILVAFVATLAGRALNVYPLSFLLNLNRKNKIPINFQHVLFLSGLRGAMAFALALRNTLSEPRQLMLTTTSLIVIVTVIFFGGSINSILKRLDIPMNVDENAQEMVPISEDRSDHGSSTSGGGGTHGASSGSRMSDSDRTTSRAHFEKSWFVRKWYNFDVKFMKPLLTNSRPTLMDTMPECMLPISRLLTTTEQLNDDHFSQRKRLEDGYDSEDDGLYCPDAFNHNHLPSSTTTSTIVAAPNGVHTDLLPAAGVTRTRLMSPHHLEDMIAFVDPLNPPGSPNKSHPHPPNERF